MNVYCIMYRIRILVYQSTNSDVMVDYLETNGFNVSVTSLENATQALEKGAYDICITDIVEDAPDALELVKLARSVSDVKPLIVVSDSVPYDYIIKALNEGADDYLIRPYNYMELVARINAIVRRSNINVRPIETYYKIGNIVFDTRTRELDYFGEKTQLEPKEAKLLALFCAYKNEIVKKEELIQQAWNHNGYNALKQLTYYVVRLRGHLKKDPLVSIECSGKVGYILRA